METTKFTPGPWTIDPRISTRVTGPEDRGICSTGGYTRNTGDADALLAENEANARLIAASPLAHRILSALAQQDNPIIQGWLDSICIPDSEQTYGDAIRSYLLTTNATKGGEE